MKKTKKSWLNVFSTISVKITVILFFVSIVFGVLSLILLEIYGWLSNMLLTICGGVFTGLVMYWLTNIRQANILRMEREFSLLLELRHCCLQNVREIDCVISQKANSLDFDEVFVSLFAKMEKAQSILYDRMSYELFKQCGLEEENPLDYETTNMLFDRYKYVDNIDAEIYILLAQLGKMQGELSQKIAPLLEKKKEAIDACYKYGL